MTDTNNNQSTGQPTPIDKPKNKGGRPKGSKVQLGLSLKKRLAKLKEMIESPNTREADRVQAVKLMSELLGDKLVNETQEKDLYLIKFEPIEEDNTETNSSDTSSKALTPPSNTPNNIANEEVKIGVIQQGLNVQVIDNEGDMAKKGKSGEGDVIFDVNKSLQGQNTSKTPIKTPFFDNDDNNTHVSDQMISDAERKSKQARARLVKLRHIAKQRKEQEEKNKPIILQSNDATNFTPSNNDIDLTGDIFGDQAPLL